MLAGVVWRIIPVVPSSKPQRKAPPRPSRKDPPRHRPLGRAPEGRAPDGGVPKGSPPKSAARIAPKERGVGKPPNPRKPMLVRDVHGGDLKDMFEIFPDIPRPPRPSRKRAAAKTRRLR